MNSPNARNMRKSSCKQESNKSDSSSPETVNKRSDPASPNTRQKRNPPSKETEVTRRFSLASSISSSATRRTKGALAPNLKAKRHEIKSDPTPLGYEDTLRDAVPSESKRSSTISTNSAVTRSTSQQGWTNRQIPSLDTCEDFEAILSSPEEISNSSEAEEEPNNKNDRGLFRVQVTYDPKTSEQLSLESGDLVQCLEEGENGQWLVKNLTTQKTGLVPSSILKTAGGVHLNSNSDFFSDMCTAALTDTEEKEREYMGNRATETKVAS
ncbi:guanine nucleotide exchange factor DBS-like isoform X3 [Polyodon spathula]|uniref:guanine nucleotide exchange factor DBS-like isoform X3 n=1 Tax=Polyodon spathula TaxID=7913 RepID=UPI001B7E6D9F|nr:guanine nucleotide exchange factor DBS-like isoform X3 [Polyodon spathula]